MSDQPVFRREVRSYVLRGGRMTSSQQRAFDTLWPAYGLELQDIELDLAAVFPSPGPTILEIGFGMGDSLAEMAAKDRGSNFIGVEVHKPGVGRLLHLAESAGLNNLRIFCADALEVLAQSIPDASLRRVQLFFPDPWHKKRHHKRRIVQAKFVDLVMRKLEAGGRLHVATDWQNYAEQILELLDATPGLVNTAGAGNFAAKPDYRPSTKFERRGERLGHEVWDLVYEKV